MDKKDLPKIKKLPKDVQNAQWALDSAVVRGEPEEVIHDLRLKLEVAKMNNGM